MLPGDLSRNEAGFLDEQNITRIDMPLEAFMQRLSEAEAAEPALA